MAYRFKHSLIKAWTGSGSASLSCAAYLATKVGVLLIWCPFSAGTAQRCKSDAQVLRICFALRIGCEQIALGIVRYVSRWVPSLAVAFGVALGLFASTKVPTTVMNAVTFSVCISALERKKPRPS